MLSNDPPSEDYSQLYWRYLYEFKVRRFKFAQRRALEAFLDLTYGQEQADIRIGSLEELAEAIESTPNNNNPVIAQLVSWDVLGHDERKKTWWLKEIDLWRVACSNQADPDRALRAVAAMERIIADDKLRFQQAELYPRETTDAEVAAEGAQARATDWSATGLPPAVKPPVGPPAGGSEFQNAPAPIQGQGLLKSRTSILKNRSEILKNRTSASSTRATAPSASEPGNQVKLKPGSPGQGGIGGSAIRLDPEGWRLLDELEEFGGPQPEDKRINWAWRIWKKPHVVERALREVQAQVRDPYADPVNSRYGLMKQFWLAWSGEGRPTTAVAARVAAAPPMVTATQEAPSREQQQAAEDDLAGEQRRKEGHEKMLVMKAQFRAQFYGGGREP